MRSEILSPPSTPRKKISLKCHDLISHFTSPVYKYLHTFILCTYLFIFNEQTIQDKKNSILLTTKT